MKKYPGRQRILSRKYGEKIVLCHPERLGLRRHIISCGDLTEKYGAVMILEDDLYVSPDFYNYAMRALDKYGEHPQIAGIALSTKRELLESTFPFFRFGMDMMYFSSSLLHPGGRCGMKECGAHFGNGMAGIQSFHGIRMSRKAS